MSQDRFDTLAGGEQTGEELMAHAVQMGGYTLMGGEQRGADLLTVSEQNRPEMVTADHAAGEEPAEGRDEDSSELRSAA